MRYPVCNLISDVIIVGGGAAALIAALEAKKSGSDVLLVSKGLIGRGGNTIVSGAGFSGYLPMRVSEDSVEQFKLDTLNSGKGINREDLLKIFIERSGSTILELENYGVQFSKAYGDYVRRRPPGHSQPRQIPTVFDHVPYYTRGLSITLPLREAAQKCGIRFIEKTQIIKLLQDRDGVCGALGINFSTSEYTQIAARAVILATGGGGMIYEKTNNTSDVTGDGYSLALDVGARLVDMEFVQFYPTMATTPLKIAVSNPLFGDGAVLRNKKMERFLIKYDPAGDMATRDSMSRAIFSEVQKGNGVNGGVYIDCRGILSDVLAHRYKAFFEHLLDHGIDLKKDLLIISPTTHFFMGGIVIDENCSAGVPGLFAAGEVVGGLHGANRLSGNALTETVVFGKIAGQMAAKQAKKSKFYRIFNKLYDEQFGQRTANLTEIKKSLRHTMWENVSVVRSESSLKNASEQISLCQKELTTHKTRGLRELAIKHSLQKMLTVAEVVTRSALLRKESRGSHYRSDFPDSDCSDWIGNVEVAKAGNHISLEFIHKNLESR